MDLAKEWVEWLPITVQSEINLDNKLDLSSIFIDSVPVGKGRPRFTRSGRCYTPSATKQAEQSVRLAAENQRDKGMLTGSVGVLVLAVFPVPKSWSKPKQQQAMAGKIRPGVKPDFDNVAKLYCDALNGVVWQDDKQIVDGRCIKLYGQQPGVLILYWPL
ncbi:RusA family crossover junction endodeoxyribonuclease [Endozoicomonas sp. YOMI1]|uniref:RusA family crossover junction endodeoxyribonuclease n=1 Tax=Endozoicomonas sp. YOMI1 TaxID=2828739 RepID=UPI002148E4B5|nr:RusA family crossover junction endodeoxyribonuclease [Endozoicomonas sp. YOMI1]